MHLMYSIDPKTGKRLYTLKKVAPDGKASTSAHPGTCFLLIVSVVCFFKTVSNLHICFFLPFFFFFSFFSPILTWWQILIATCGMQKTIWTSHDPAASRWNVRRLSQFTTTRKKKEKKKYKSKKRDLVTLLEKTSFRH